MKTLTRDEFANLVATSGLNKRRRELLRFVPEEITDWESRDFLAVFEKSGNAGVLIYQDRSTPFALSRRTPNSMGRTEAIICDICATWQRGTASAVMTLKKSDKSTVSYLVCGDLLCSLHVRTLTDAGVLSRTQLRENISSEARIERFHERLRGIIK